MRTEKKYLNRQELQEAILYFLHSNFNKKFPVWKIWEQLLAEKYKLSYQRVQQATLWLQYQRESKIKTEKSGYNKLVWIKK